MNSATRLLRALLARGAYLESLTRAELRAILPILERAHEEVLGKIAKTGGAWTREWLTEMAGDLEAIYKAACAEAWVTVSADLEELAKNEGAWALGEIGQATIGISLSTPAPSLLKAVVNLPTNIGGSTLEHQFEALGIESKKAAYEAIQQGMLAGDTVDEMTRRLRGEVKKRAIWRRDSDGVRRYHPGVYEGGVIEGVSTRGAERVARTAIMHVSNQAREITYAANEDISKGYQYVATLDTNTCLVCANDDGRVFGLRDPRPVLPRHIGDRCLYVPVLKSWRELGIDADELPEGTRASMDGQVAESETFADRLTKASAERQVAMLRSPTKARLYREGMPLSEMVEDGHEVPVKVLLERAAERRKKGRAA
ncbi:MAG: hypothetical protein JNG85_14745 [Spirochaetaceae bacterium]|nr:hypothetical protein [Spirochaetaceae bacterium]